MNLEGLSEFKPTLDRSEGPVRDIKALEVSPSDADLELARRSLVPTDDESAQHFDKVLRLLAMSFKDTAFRRRMEMHEKKEDQNG